MKRLSLVAFAFLLLFAACEKEPVDDNNNNNNPGDPYVAPDSLTTFNALVNDLRSKGCYCNNDWYGPVGSMSADGMLLQIAQGHSNDMDAMNDMTHIGSDGRDGEQRLDDAGYAWMAWGENIAYGYPDERQLFLAWLASPSHCTNLMNQYFSRYGLARSGSYWTLLLARPM